MSLGLATVLLASALSSAPFTPTSEYIEEKVEGFTVLVSPEVAVRPGQWEHLRKLMAAQLAEVSRVVPGSALPGLRKTRIWVEWKAKDNSAAEFHGSREWLVTHRYNPEKFRGVEINNLENFISWSRQKDASIMLHELAHSHFSRLPEYDRLLVDLAYAEALESGRYERVPTHDGSTARAYALTDSREYFAELTEAFFGRNDFYPFVRGEMGKHDPAGYEVILRSWGELP